MQHAATAAGAEVLTNTVAAVPDVASILLYSPSQATADSAHGLYVEALATAAAALCIRVLKHKLRRDWSCLQNKRAVRHHVTLTRAKHSSHRT